MRNISLKGKWEFSKRGESEKMPAIVPGTNYHDLLRLKKISDPFIGKNEKDSYFVAREDWDYFKTFTVSSESLEADRLVLCCDQLDTICRVYVNDTLVGEGKNAHVGYEFDIKESTHVGENALRIEFDSPVNYIEARNKEDAAPANSQSMSGMIHIRKPQSHFGWDWGPTIPISGVTGDIYLKHVVGAEITKIDIEQKHRSKSVAVSVVAEAKAYTKATEMLIEVFSPDGKKIAENKASNTALRLETDIIDPELWWIAELSDKKEQPLYTVVVTILSENGETLAKEEKKIGLRTIELDRSEDEWGQNYRFIINSVPIFAKGGNYIPMDSLIDRVTTADKEALLQNCLDTNMNMIRIWGGGYYETNEFYDLCDKMGILVWQDFQFACAPYPFYNEEFLANVKEEVTYNVRRLRHRASLALWCGNNEIETMSIAWKHKRELVKWTEKYFWNILPDWMLKLDRTTPFVNGSPIGSAYMKDNASDKVGDTHLWQVWHGLMSLDFYRKRYTRFCSEFGLQSMPSMETIRYFAKPEDYSLTGDVFNAHQKSPSGNMKIYYYVSQKYRIPKKFEEILYLTQLIQKEGVRDATEHWRRNRGRCNGSIYWQLNDCWPVSSWSGIDYLGRNKAIQYGSKRFNQSLTVSVENNKNDFKIFLLNDTMQDENIELRAKVMDFSGHVVWSNDLTTVAPALTSKHAVTYRVADLLAGKRRQDVFFTIDMLQDGKRIARRNLLFCEEKEASLPETRIRKEVEIKDGKAYVTLTADVFARHLFLESSELTGNFDDNFFDILPSESVTVVSKVKDGASAESVQSSIDIITVGDITDAQTEFFGFRKRAKLMANPINFFTWVGYKTGIV